MVLNILLCAFIILMKSALNDLTASKKYKLQKSYPKGSSVKSAPGKIPAQYETFSEISYYTILVTKIVTEEVIIKNMIF